MNERIFNITLNVNIPALSELNRKLDELIRLHKGEEQLKAAADKLGVSTDALAEALRIKPEPNPQPKEKT